MSNAKWRPGASLSMLAIPLALGASLLIHGKSLGADAAPVTGTGANEAVVYDYADQVTRLVQGQKIDELSKLNIPQAGGSTNKLQVWTKEYVSEIQHQADERDKQYSDEVTKATDFLNREKYDQAMGDVVSAYLITKDQNAFLKLDWVNNLTGKVAKRASELEKQGNWLQSLQLYSDLDSLYEIDTRYKADSQRLARRVRLLAMYTPETLVTMRKAINAQFEKDNPSTQPASTQPTTQNDLDDSSGFTRWQDYVEGVASDMCRDAIDRAAADWVEQTSYEQLIKGGTDALRLFLTTPELANEFKGLGDAGARDAFAKALDDAVASSSGKTMDSAALDGVMQSLIQANKDTVKLPQEVLLLEFTDGAMEKLDRFTAVIWPHEVDEFEQTTRGTFGGVGIQISLERDDVKIEEAQLKKIDPGATPSVLDKDQKAGSHYHLVVISPLEDTPAYKAGIEAGDIITGIDGKSTLHISIDQAVHSIMGKPGTQVTLKIKRGTQAEKDYELTRDIIKVTSIKGFRRDPSDMSRWDFMLDPDSKIGYIRITGFQDDTAQELRNALQQLQSDGLRGVILDLRFNPGGLLKAATEISDMFLQDGVIVSTRGRSENAPEQVWKADKDTMIPANMPMVVLVNQYSASASEIFSGAMKDLHRALIVGHRSFGKGSVQNLIKVGDRNDAMAWMKLTMAYYYLPLGESLHRRDGSKNWGVDPDVEVNLTPKQVGELLRVRRDNDVIPATGVPAPVDTKPAPTTSEKPVSDTQLDTALLMMRLQLIQSHG